MSKTLPTDRLTFSKPTDDEKREWAQANISRRAEWSSRVYEYDMVTNTIFVLRRTSMAPIKPNTSGSLEFLGIIREPDMQLRVKMNENADKHFPV
jgi:hypothetical protein